jgi:hypothetical protein
VKSIKKIGFWALAVLVVCVIAFVIAELGIRFIRPQMTGPIQLAFDSELGPIPVPNQHGRRTIPGVYSYTFNNNSLGLRGNREYSYQKQSDFRILLLGDSFCYGFGVDDDQTFACGIEKNLSSENWSTEVINAGNGGQGTDYALKFFSTLGYRFRPDLTVLCFFANDFADNGRYLYYSIGKDGDLSPISLSNSLEVKKEFLKVVPMYDWLISWSHVANFLKQTALRILVEHGKATKNRAFGLVQHYGNGDGRKGFSNERNVKLTEIFISRLKKTVEDRGSDFIIIYIPTAEGVKHYRESGEYSNDEKALYNILKPEGEALLSMTPIISGSKEPISSLYYVEEHWTPVAHSLVANYISDYIRKRFKSLF